MYNPLAFGLIDYEITAKEAETYLKDYPDKILYTYLSIFSDNEIATIEVKLDIKDFLDQTNGNEPLKIIMDVTGNLVVISSK